MSKAAVRLGVTVVDFVLGIVLSSVVVPEYIIYISGHLLRDLKHMNKKHVAVQSIPVATRIW